MLRQGLSQWSRNATGSGQKIYVRRCMEKSTFLQNVLEASVIEQAFVFLDDNGNLASPKRISSAGATIGEGALMAGAAAVAVGLAALFGGSGHVLAYARAPFGRGNGDAPALAAILQKYGKIADLVGVRIKTGQIVFRLAVDGDTIGFSTLIDLCAVIHRESVYLRRFADSFGGYVSSLSQVLVTFSHHSTAHAFTELANKCMHGTASTYVVTQPWIIDLQKEGLMTCAGFRQWRRMVAPDAKRMLPRLFQPRRA